MYIYNLGLKQNIIVTLDDYLLLCGGGDGSSGGGRVGAGGGNGSGSDCNGCDYCLLL